MEPMPECKCLRCGHVWTPKTSKPKCCGSCKSALWKKKRVKPRRSLTTAQKAKLSEARKGDVTVDPVTLTNARIASGLSQEMVAKKFEVNRSTVSRWEQGKYVPPLETIFKLLKLYMADMGFIKK